MDGREYAYRTAYEREVGPIPDKHSLHHTCENKWCVEVTHLEPMLQGQHLIEHGLPGDWGQADKTHCPKNHPYDEENTYVWTDPKTGSQERGCKECRREAKRRYRERLRSQGMPVK